MRRRSETPGLAPAIRPGSGGATRTHATRLGARWSRLCKSLPRVLRQVLGAPDYAAYLDHCRRAGHPPRLGEREYLDEFFARRGKSPRCC